MVQLTLLINTKAWPSAHTGNTGQSCQGSDISSDVIIPHRAMCYLHSDLYFSARQHVSLSSSETVNCPSFPSAAGGGYFKLALLNTK